jgi:hypothetical protein
MRKDISDVFSYFASATMQGIAEIKKVETGVGKPARWRQGKEYSIRAQGTGK